MWGQNGQPLEENVVLLLKEDDSSHLGSIS